jgi:hypothetical protein
MEKLVRECDGCPKLYLQGSRYMVYSPRFVFAEMCSRNMFGSTFQSDMYLLLTRVAIPELYGVLQAFLLVEFCCVSTSESDSHSLYSRQCSLISQGVGCLPRCSKGENAYPVFNGV